MSLSAYIRKEKRLKYITYSCTLENDKKEQFKLKTSERRESIKIKTEISDI